MITKTEYMTKVVEQEEELPAMGVEITVILVVVLIILILSIIALIFVCSMKKRQMKQPIKLKTGIGRPSFASKWKGMDEE